MSVRARWENAVTKSDGTTWDVILREKQAWSCKVHDAPLPYEYEDGGGEIDFDFPIYGCTCDTTAKWEPVIGPRGVVLLEFVLEGVLSKLLRAYYLPQLTETLNSTILFDALLKDTP